MMESTPMTDTTMTFGQAIEAMKAGESVARVGWNGKGMCLWLNKGSIALGDVPSPGLLEALPPCLFDKGDTGTICRLPNINMRTAGGETLTGWLASQTDMLAEDWAIVP
jgi:hypothetical protein